MFMLRNGLHKSLLFKVRWKREEIYFDNSFVFSDMYFRLQQCCRA